jgi:mannose-1-phosphate guanylyltransferase/mannose-6-phosphate isomerase
MTSKTITPAIMIGGAGSRLWPLSRPDKPKQFLKLTGPATMLQSTVMRFDASGFDAPWLLANTDTLDHVLGQLKELNLDAEGIVVEPAMRGTAAAIAAITVTLHREDPERLILVAPADHFIRDEAGFRAAVQSAVPIAAAGDIVTFGIAPTGPETGFGYIAGGAPVVIDGVLLGDRIEKGGFREKPDYETAQQFVEDGYLWNAGIFLFKASTMLEQLELHAPGTLAAVKAACNEGHEEGSGTLRLVRPNALEFGYVPLELSIDVGVMERTDQAVVVPCRDIGWSDVGSLSALWEIAPKDLDGNAVTGDVMLLDTANSFVHSSSGRKIVLAHVEGVTLVDTEDALIVLPTSEAQAVKTIVKMLKGSGAPELTCSREAHFAWGEVHLDHASDDHAALTMQLVAGGHLRSREVTAAFETWLVTQGAMSVSVGDRNLLVAAGQSVSFTAGDVISIAATEKAIIAIASAPSAATLAQNFASGSDAAPPVVFQPTAREVA